MTLARLLPLALAGPAIAAPPRLPPIDGAIPSREAWRPRFAMRADWHAFVAGTPGGVEAARTCADLCPYAAILILRGGDDPRGGGCDLNGDMAAVRGEGDRDVRDRVPPPPDAAPPLADEP